jgi:hypothetical protein
LIALLFPLSPWVASALSDVTGTINTAKNHGKPHEIFRSFSVSTVFSLTLYFSIFFALFASLR